MREKKYVRPRKWRQAFEHVVSEFLGWEVAVLQEGTGFNLHIADRAKFLYQSAEWMEGANGLQFGLVSF